MSCWQLAMAPSCLYLQEELLILLFAQHHTLWGNIYNSLKRKNIRKELWKAIFAHNSFYFYMPHQLQLDIIKMQDITDVVRILRNFS